MTDLETLLRAKSYIDKLANGVDPITGMELPQDTVLNNVRLSRCFFYVSDLLRQIADNGGVIDSKRNQAALPPFTITQEDIAKVTLPESPAVISQFCKSVNAAVNRPNHKLLSHKTIIDWLVDKGFLSVELNGGKSRKRVTDAGKGIGISEDPREGQYGGYIAILYDTRAQQFILDNLVGILDASV